MLLGSHGHVLAGAEGEDVGVAVHADVPTGALLQRVAAEEAARIVEQRRPSSLGGWKTRFFVLAEGELVYYEKENGIEKGSLRD